MSSNCTDVWRFFTLAVQSLDTNEPRSVNRKSFIEHFMELNLLINVETAIGPHVSNFETSSLLFFPEPEVTVIGREGGAEEDDLIGCD